MARNGTKYNYGNGAATTEAIKRVKLPEKIKCGRCQKQKGHHSYSNNRLGDLKAHIFKNAGFDATKQGHVSCQMCSGAGAQQLELDCVGCDRVLPNARFSKVQRRNPDNARCIACMEKRLDYEPGAGSSDNDSGHGGSSDDSDDYGDDASDAAATFSTMSINGSGSAGGVNLNGSSAPQSSAASGNGTASNTRAMSASNRDTNTGSIATTGTARSNWTTTSPSASTSSILPSNFDPKAYGTPPHLRGQGAAGSLRDSSGGGKFAKVKASDAVKRPINGRPPTKQQPAAAPGTQEDDDIGVAPDSDSD